MRNGMNRFEFYLQYLEGMMQHAAKETNPALWLYSNDARTPFFMLEGLSRLYANLHNKKKFATLKDQFKSMEDGFGMVDYYDNYAKIFQAHPTVPVHLREYMQAQSREKMQRANDLLKSDDWITEGHIRFKKMRKKLKQADWLQPKDEAKAIRAFYKDEITGIKKSVLAANGLFTEIESQVHEFRRNIRWLSIYPQALQGLIQLTDSGESSGTIQKYLLPEIVNSKYNKMPDAGSNTWFLMLEKNNFLGLSWLISETGKIKDEGLQVFALTEALQQTEGLSHDEAWTRAFSILQLENDHIDKLLTRASQVIHTFIKEKHLDKLTYCLAHAKQSVGE